MKCDSLFNRRLDICRACEEFMPAAGHGACRLIRDPSERVCGARFTQVLWNGTCPRGKFEELNRAMGRR